ncbi:MAG TPA: hypothetical protein PKO09_03315 [Anaerolineae bacterium]|nr:hypothetical protein [Anaerolineae bacterium]
MIHGREFDQAGLYRIRIKGTLGDDWSDWFDGFRFDHLAQNETVLTGPVADQAALHGILCKLRDLGLPLLLVERVEAGRADNEKHAARRP